MGERRAAGMVEPPFRFSGTGWAVRRAEGEVARAPACFAPALGLEGDFDREVLGFERDTGARAEVVFVREEADCEDPFPGRDWAAGDLLLGLERERAPFEPGCFSDFMRAEEANRGYPGGWRASERHQTPGDKPRLGGFCKRKNPGTRETGASASCGTEIQRAPPDVGEGSRGERLGIGMPGRICELRNGEDAPSPPRCGRGIARGSRHWNAELRADCGCADELMASVRWVSALECRATC